MDHSDFLNYDISTPEFTLNGMCLHGRLVDIIDGDSLVIIIPVFDGFYKYHVRINGIDTCEMKSKSEQNKRLALRARSEILNLVTNSEFQYDIDRKSIQKTLNDKVYVVYLECCEFDKYGRLLANVYIDNSKEQCFAKHLVDVNLAYRYTGETKLTEQEQLQILKNNI
jgi:endonuclease YncB( thermonuclease family)